jgi:hypothetical protein
MRNAQPAAPIFISATCKESAILFFMPLPLLLSTPHAADATPASFSPSDDGCRRCRHIFAADFAVAIFVIVTFCHAALLRPPRTRRSGAHDARLLMPILPFFIAYACFSPPLPDYFQAAHLFRHAIHASTCLMPPLTPG